mgnify:CR=1 FL=1
MQQVWDTGSWLFTKVKPCCMLIITRKWPLTRKRTTTVFRWTGKFQRLTNGYILYFILYDFHNFTLYSKFYLQLVIMNSLNELGPVFQKSQTLSDLFWEPQFPLYLRKAEVLNHQTSQSCAKKLSGLSRNRPLLPVGLWTQLVEHCRGQGSNSFQVLSLVA